MATTAVFRTLGDAGKLPDNYVNLYYKERLVGVTNCEGNHVEDVKEYYFYLDSTPTHSYRKYLYKYHQAVYPDADRVETNWRRTRYEMEYATLWPSGRQGFLAGA